MGLDKCGKIVVCVEVHGKRTWQCSGSYTNFQDYGSAFSVTCRTCGKYALNAIKMTTTCSKCGTTFVFGTSVGACLCGEGRMWYDTPGATHTASKSCTKGTYSTVAGCSEHSISISHFYCAAHYDNNCSQYH